ncbi:Hsp20-type molecular chaperone [Natronomonas pharaonis DSM 2160]|uniref:Hsp20-type molecular chaperone n=1 Tax=Natronomonas pharaonis (strain ATCC 35678 / DSM 2160 / CIP 103997 / JCM 8858 / NBRC 14720 / NCIMB 2260 / Gabara) TaxID=348780 RepID=A0A1U7ET89_NATPD|nr:Hsp20/alpha crystallin family protein [Natronomonas pharaonis]CAI48096.1 Hsp20-type molecular chaperone [Natronomonas pharaonis DSM 2160]
MRRDDRDDPFDDIFDEIERMMNQMTGGIDAGDAGFGGDAHVSVYEDDDEIRVVADLPGVDKDDLTIQCDGRRVTIAATTDHSDYKERIELPARVDEHSASATFNNGVLEVEFERTGSSADIDLS